MTEIEIYQSESEFRTNSKNISSVFHRQHRHVLRDIEKLDCSEEFRQSNYGLSSYISEQNKELPCVDMTKDGFVFLCMGWRGKKAAEFKEQYIAEFNRMAETLGSFTERANKLERDKKALKDVGRKWSELGRDLGKSKNKHKIQSAKLLDEVQIKIEF